MRDILSVLSASIAPINLPFTVLLGLVVVYWVTVIIGVLDLESADAAFDLDGLEGDVGGGAVIPSGTTLNQILKFFNVGEVPVMIILSFIILSMWAFSVLANHYLNPEQAVWKALLLLVPNLLFSALLTRYLTKPLKAVFGALNKDYDERTPIVGQVGRVLTGEVTKDFGQVEIEARGAPIRIQARLAGNSVLRRGDLALVVAEDQERRLFQVIKFEQPTLEE